MSINPSYKKISLPNGLKCILYPRAEIHSVTIRVNVKVGSLDENENTNGVSHFIEHVVHEGTRDFPTWLEVENFKTEHSASTNAYTTTDHTQYYGTFPSQYLEAAIKYFSQITFYPLFSQHDVERERTIIIDEMKSYKDEVDYHVVQNVKDSRFEKSDTEYSYDVIGTKERLDKLTPEDLRAFWQKYYIPQNMEIYVVGNFDEDSIIELLNKYFYNDLLEFEFSKKEEKIYKNNFPEYSKFTVATRQKQDLDKYYLTVTFPSFDFKSTTLEKRCLVSFLQAMTASSSYMNSVLWKSLRQERGLVYGVHSWNYDLYARDMFGISTSFNKEHLETVLSEIYKGIEQIKKGEIDDSVFRARQKKILDTQLMQLDKPEQAINWIASFEEETEEHGKGLLLSEYLEFIQSVKFQDIIDVANEIFDWDKVNIGVVSQEDKKVVEQEVLSLWEKIRN